MTDELREALEHLEATFFGHSDDGEVIAKAVRAHLGCSTITDEKVSQVCRVLSDYFPDEDSEVIEDATLAALEAAAQVRKDSGDLVAALVATPVATLPDPILRPLQSDSLFSCDWGDCDNDAYMERLTLNNWLPVCSTHTKAR